MISANILTCLISSILVLSCLVKNGHSEIFTAMVELKQTLHTERHIAVDLKQYIVQEEERLRKLKSIADDYEKHSHDALNDIDGYLGNPINAFLLVKRFTADWNKVEDLISNNSASDILNRLQEKRKNFPDENDLNGAATALLRLQDTYALTTAKMAKGELQGIKESPEMTANDCFELGKISYNSGDHYHCIMWMSEALEILNKEDVKTADKAVILDYLAYSHYVERNGHASPTKSPKQFTFNNAADCYELGRIAYNDRDYYHTVMWIQEALSKWEEEEVKSVDKPTLLDYLAFAMSMQGNLKMAKDLTEEWLEMEPNHERARNNKIYYDQVIAEEEAKTSRKGDEADLPAVQNQRQINDYRGSEEFVTYEKLCRGENTHEIPNAHRLTCQYVDLGHPYFKVGPLKEEVTYHNPLIRIYHQMITESEMALIKEMAAPRLNRATVQNALTGQLETANYRISKSAWLREEEHPLLARLNRRIYAVTGLNLETAEDLQVVNYGIGGHYEPHYDFARPEEKATFPEWQGNRVATVIFYKEEKNAFKSLGDVGNRIATVIFYMTDVPAGGATVFPSIGVKLFPEKGAGAFWYNLLRSGEGDYSTRHAACPVLTGQKWVSNKWIHERGQELHRPCGLTERE